MGMNAKLSSYTLKLYTMPGCHKCHILAEKLKEMGVGFEERRFDTDAQLEFIMRDYFGNPPILEAPDRTACAEDLFDDHGNLIPEKLDQFLNGGKWISRGEVNMI